MTMLAVVRHSNSPDHLWFPNVLLSTLVFCSPLNATTVARNRTLVLNLSNAAP